MGAALAYLSPCKNQIKENISVGVVFGSPGKSCTGHGICDLTLRDQPHFKQPGTCQPVPANLLADPTGYLALEFPKATLPAATRQQHLSQNWFIVEEAYCIPQALLSDSGLSGLLNATIYPGRYPIFDLGDALRIQF